MENFITLIEIIIEKNLLNVNFFIISYNISLQMSTCLLPLCQKGNIALTIQIAPPVFNAMKYLLLPIRERFPFQVFIHIAFSVGHAENQERGLRWVGRQPQKIRITDSHCF